MKTIMKSLLTAAAMTAGSAYAQAPALIQSAIEGCCAAGSACCGMACC